MTPNSLPQRPLAARGDRASLHRPAPMKLPHDPATATAAVVARINGQDKVDRAAAVEAMAMRISALKDAGVDITRYELEFHLPVLKALFLRFSAEAASAGNAEQRAKLAKIAFSAHESYARAVALLAGLQLQSGNHARVIRENET